MAIPFSLQQLTMRSQANERRNEPRVCQTDFLDIGVCYGHLAIDWFHPKSWSISICETVSNRPCASTQTIRFKNFASGIPNDYLTNKGMDRIELDLLLFLSRFGDIVSFLWTVVGGPCLLVVDLTFLHCLRKKNTTPETLYTTIPWQSSLKMS